jgi:DEAD/DEAH box helicase domain-containing protein
MRNALSALRVRPLLLRRSSYMPELVTNLALIGNGFYYWFGHYASMHSTTPAAASRITNTATTETVTTRIVSVLVRCGWHTSAKYLQPGRPAVNAALPGALHPELASNLAGQAPAGLYRHQSRALEHLADGEDVALTTPTSSGKSLVFIAGAMQILLADRSAKVIALYPMKALGNDQFGKWRSALAASGLNVAVLDGDVPIKSREQLLANNHVLLMTPDVLHAWFMANLHLPAVRSFRDALRLVILDEAHVYDGVFGTGTAFLLRRLEACGPLYQFVASSATIGSVDTFLTQLTGRQLTVVPAEDDGSPRHEVTWHRIAAPGTQAFSSRAALMQALASENVRFIAFADSRKSAELHADAARRGGGEEIDGEFDGDEGEFPPSCGILPYRSGYEAKDRQAIEKALSSGKLRGVIATSAMELGVDIPGIDCVILIGAPPTQKSLRQRAGRTGRHRDGCVLFIDHKSVVAGSDAAFATWLNRPVEPNHLCLENRFLEFSHVLCAAVEADACRESWSAAAFAALTPRFRTLLDGERSGGQNLENDLSDLKTKACGSPHRAFSLRNGKETNFEIFHQESKLGTISFPQAMREAYPGAVYYHMATPYRVRQVKRTKAIIEVSREKRYVTTPVVQSTVFVTLRHADFLRRGDTGFLYSGDVQITERVTGFREKQGPKKVVVETYGPGCHFGQRPFERWLRSTGVCWTLRDGKSFPDEAAERILAAFCTRFARCRGDLGFGHFHCQQNPYGPSPVKGCCIYDRIEGGLGLTDDLFLHFVSIAEEAHAITASESADPSVVSALHELATAAATWQRDASIATTVDASADASGAFISVIQTGSPALYLHNDHHEQVTVLTFLFGPDGLDYLVTLAAGGTKRIKSRFIQNIEGMTTVIQVPAAVLAPQTIAA